MRDYGMAGESGSPTKPPNEVSAALGWEELIRLLDIPYID